MEDRALPRLYADFNNQDEQGRVWLIAPADLEALKDKLVDGVRVILHVPDDLEVEATLVFDRRWCGVPDYSTLRYLDGSEP